VGRLKGTLERKKDGTTKQVRRAVPIRVLFEKSFGTSAFVARINASIVKVFPWNESNRGMHDSQGAYQALHKH
jgi:hypothetical protein